MEKFDYNKMTAEGLNIMMKRKQATSEKCDTVLVTNDEHLEFTDIISTIGLGLESLIDDFIEVRFPDCKKNESIKDVCFCMMYRSVVEKILEQIVSDRITNRIEIIKDRSLKPIETEDLENEENRVNLINDLHSCLTLEDTMSDVNDYIKSIGFMPLDIDDDEEDTEDFKDSPSMSYLDKIMSDETSDLTDKDLTDEERRLLEEIFSDDE